MSETLTRTSNSHFLAVVNTAKLSPDADQRELASFKAAADPFIDRVRETNSALRAFVDPRVSDLSQGLFSGDDTMVNLTVWNTPKDLVEFLRLTHQAVYSRYGRLFAPLGVAAVALWWTPKEHTPDYVEAESRLINLREVGPTPFAFDLATVDEFPAP